MTENLNWDLDAIFPGDQIVTRAWNAYQRETYFNIEGEAMRDSTVIGRVSLQAIQAFAAPEGWHPTLKKGLEAAKKSGKPVLVITLWKDGV